MGSLIMLAAFLRQREVWTESMDGRRDGLGYIHDLLIVIIESVSPTLPPSSVRKKIQKSEVTYQPNQEQLFPAAVRLLYRFPNGRRWKRECPGCMGSLIMLAALPR